MSKILRLFKRLAAPPTPPTVPSATIRTYADLHDADVWLRLHRAALARLTVAGPAWTRAEFAREFTSKSWWSPERMWFAVLEVPGAADAERSALLPAGTITLGRSGRPPHDLATVQWLMVAPEARRRGLGAALLARAERRAWEEGERLLTLETHTDWTDAVRLYRRSGYGPENPT